jgi:hypothetical protein
MTELKTLGFLGIVLPLALFSATARVAESQIDLALQIARVSANEGALVYRSTTALVWQVVRENGGNTRAKRSAFLSRHSPRVHRQKPCLRGNCFWSPFLSRSAEKPFGLELKDIYWEQKVRPLWLRTLADADSFVAQHRADKDPCAIPPRTWGGPMDREGAMKKGLYPIGCRYEVEENCTSDSCNDGFTWAKDCWLDGAWVCDPAAEPHFRANNPAVAERLALHVQSRPGSR